MNGAHEEKKWLQFSRDKASSGKNSYYTGTDFMAIFRNCFVCIEILLLKKCLYIFIEDSILF